MEVNSTFRFVSSLLCFYWLFLVTHSITPTILSSFSASVLANFVKLAFIPASLFWAAVACPPNIKLGRNWPPRLSYHSRTTRAGDLHFTSHFPVAASKFRSKRNNGFVIMDKFAPNASIKEISPMPKISPKESHLKWIRSSYTILLHMLKAVEPPAPGFSKISTTHSARPQLGKRLRASLH